MKVTKEVTIHRPNISKQTSHLLVDTITLINTLCYTTFSCMCDVPPYLYMCRETKKSSSMFSCKQNLWSSDKVWQNQKCLYNGDKNVHAIKVSIYCSTHAVVFFANLFGPVEGKRYDSGMLARSRVLNQLQWFSVDTNRNPLCIYGDPAYPLYLHLQGHFRGAGLTPIQSAWNESMSKVRVSVEWIFGDIINYFKFLLLLLRLQLRSLSKGVPSSHLKKDQRLILGHTCIYSWKRHVLCYAVFGFTRDRWLNTLYRIVWETKYGRFTTLNIQKCEHFTLLVCPLWFLVISVIRWLGNVQSFKTYMLRLCAFCHEHDPG